VARFGGVERVGIRGRGWLRPDHAIQLCHCLPIPRAFRQHLPPEPLGLGMIAALRGKGRQIAPGQVAIDSLIHAAKLVGKAIHDGHAFRAVCSILAGLALALVLVIVVEIVSAVVHPVPPV
jgi:hypothetical protein